MTDKNTLFSIVLFIVVFAVCSPSYSKTIVIPGDAASVQEAVDLAADGDLVLIQSEAVDLCVENFVGGLRIVGKEITISGRSAENKTLINAQGIAQMFGEEYPYPRSSRTSSIWIEDASVTMRGLRMSGPLKIVGGTAATACYYGAPIYVESGSLCLVDCDLTCNIESRSNLRIERSSIQGYSYQDAQYDAQNTDEPCLSVLGGERIIIDIVDSTVDCNNDRGYNGVLLEGSSGAEFYLLRSVIRGGSFDDSTANRVAIPSKKGGYGFTVRDCENIRLAFDDGKVYGGEGTPMNGQWMSQHQDESELYAGNGGEGLMLERSTGFLEGGTFIGGNGGNSTPMLENHGFRMYMIPGGDGGYGISLRQSRLSYGNVMAQGGSGGLSVVYEGIQLPAGNDGERWLVDDSSEAIPLSGIVDWTLLFK